MSSKQYDVTIPTTLYVTVRVSIPDDHEHADDPNDIAIDAALEAVGEAIFSDAAGGISIQPPATSLRYDDEFHHPWSQSIDLDVVEVEESHDRA